MMSTAGSMRPPMSKVSATPGPAAGMVRYVSADPAATRLPAVQPDPLGGAGGSGLLGMGRGVASGSPLTTRTQPGSITFGFVASDG